ncbi:hypothetical protein ACVW1A_000348 [Bradyrhizobium sp. LB1.3]
MDVCSGGLTASASLRPAAYGVGDIAGADVRRQGRPAGTLVDYWRGIEKVGSASLPV